MYKLVLEDKAGNALSLTDRKEYSVLDIQGLNPPSSKINTSETATGDGGRYHSSKMNMRNILVQFSINFDVEKSRTALYRVIHSKQYIKIKYTNETFDVYAEGYVESFDIDYFSQKQLVTLSILCANPYWKKDVTTKYTSKTKLQNNGQVACGFTCTLSLKGVSLKAIKISDGTKEFLLSSEKNAYSRAMSQGDIITVHTERNQRYATLTGGNETLNATIDLYHNVVHNSWLQLQVGENNIAIECTDTSGHVLTASEMSTKMDINFTYSQLYEGV